MGDKKFELTENTKEWFGTTLHQLRALKSFNNVKAGELGGWVEKEENLSQDGNAWVCENAHVHGNAKVYQNAKVCGDADVYGDTKVYGNAWICGNAWVCGSAEVYGNVELCGNAHVYGDAKVYGNAWVRGNAKVYGDAKVCENAEVYGNARVCGNAEVRKKDDYILITNIGSRIDTTTVYKDKKLGIAVSCGCFYGSLKQFEEAVEKTHGDNKYSKEYKAVIALAKVHFEVEE